ncbi:hypothetical protein ACVTNA_25920, partial [Escherichia coli]
FDLLAGLPNDIRLYLVGNCWPKRLEKRSKQIYVIHPTSYYDIIRIYSAIDMVLITSPYERRPCMSPEALAAGCLVFHLVVVWLKIYWILGFSLITTSLVI